MTPITLTHTNGLSITVSPFGATWLSCIVPLAAPREVLLGCHVDDLAEQKAYLGASVGRYANRIAGACYRIGEQAYHLSANQNGEHTLHGGADNFAYRLWDIEDVSDTHATFVIHSSDGDQGFNGNFTARVTYSLREAGITIDYQASCDQASVCALTNHAYFSLDGDGSGDARTQRLRIPSEYYLPLDKEGIPNAPLTHVANTPFDFRQLKAIIQDFDKIRQPLGGYDHDWYFGAGGDEKFVCQLQSADEKVTLSLYTTQPALRVYSGNFLAGTPTRDGNEYADFAGIALETGALANSPNLPDYRADCFISPNQPYHHCTTYRFNWTP